MESIQEIETQLLNFQKLKLKYQENRNQLGLLQAEMNQHLFKEKNTGDIQDFENVIEQCECLRRDILEFEQLWPMMKQQTSMLSIQIQSLLKH